MADICFSRAEARIDVMFDAYREEFYRTIVASLLAERFADEDDIGHCRFVVKLLSRLEQPTQMDQDRLNEVLSDCHEMLETEYPEEYNQLLVMAADRLFKYLGVEYGIYDEEEFKMETNLNRLRMRLMP